MADSLYIYVFIHICLVQNIKVNYMFLVDKLIIEGHARQGLIFMNGKTNVHVNMV